MAGVEGVDEQKVRVSKAAGSSAKVVRSSAFGFMVF
jgi:hypothetical protein